MLIDRPDFKVTHGSLTVTNASSCVWLELVAVTWKNKTPLPPHCTHEINLEGFVPLAVCLSGALRRGTKGCCDGCVGGVSWMNGRCLRRFGG